MKKRHEQKLIILSLFLAVALNLPLILMTDSSQNLGGFPIVYVYVFSIWLVAVLLTLLIVKKYDE